MKKELKVTKMIRCLAADRLAKLANTDTRQTEQPAAAAQPVEETKRRAFRPGERLVVQTA